MAGIFVPQGISVAEQKCYLENPNDNQAIVKCLDDYRDVNGIGVLVVLALIALGVWGMAR